MFEDIRRAFPNIPEEAVRLWILPLAQKEGWPPTRQHQWDVRVTGRLFSFWNAAEWEKMDVNLSEIPYSRGFADSMLGLREAYLLGVENDYWRLLGEDGRRRFNECYIYILKNQHFPQPPILSLNDTGKYDVVDGNHRFLGFITAKSAYKAYEEMNVAQQQEFLDSLNVENLSSPNSTQEVWICKPR